MSVTSRNGYGYQSLAAPCANVYAIHSPGQMKARRSVRSSMRGRGPKSSQPIVVNQGAN